MDIEALLTPVCADAPCGENLEYDADFQAMALASQGKAEQQFGDTIIPAEPADWVKVENLAVTLLTRTKDLRVMLALAHAWTKRRGLPGYADGLALIHGALTRYWATLHPQLEDAGEFDPFYRINSLAELGDKSALAATLRQASLLRNAGGEISLRDAQALLDGSKNESPDYPGGRPRLADELARGDQPGIEALLQSQERLQNIHDLLVTELGPGGAPETEQLRKTFSTVASACQSTDILSLIPSAAQRPALANASEPGPRTVTTPSSPQFDWRSVNITSRSEAQLLLEKVKQYFLRHEPSHPAPLMIDRMQKVLDLNFMEMIRDLAPDGVHQLENIFGRNE